jgi:hypothetical protein
MAWITGIKDDPVRIAWGGTGIHNIMMISPEILGPLELLHSMPLAGVASTR